MVEAEREREGVRGGLRKEGAKGGADASGSGADEEDGDCGDESAKVVGARRELEVPLPSATGKAGMSTASDAQKDCVVKD